MANNLFITGYSGQIWNSVLQTLNYYNSNLDPTQIVQAQNLTAFTASSLKNALIALSAIQDTNQVYNNYLLLSEAFAVPVSLDANTATYIKNRLTGMLQFSENQTRFNVTLTAPNYAYVQDTLPIADPQYLEYILNFVGEPNPIYGSLVTQTNQPITTESLQPITLGTISTIIQAAQEAADAWLTLATALESSGFPYTGSAYNAVIQMYESSMVAYQMLVDADLVNQNSLQTAWNNLVSIPSMLGMAALTGNDPTSLQSQNVNTAKYIIGTTLKSLDTTLVSLRQQVAGNIQLATVRENDNLMDMAARSLGNFEQWTQIAATNNLQPPYIASGVTALTAVPGQQLFLPTTGVVQTQGTVPSYTLNYLGVDIYYGPLNQDIAVWAGDFQLISGYQNLSFSLGRRLQTTLGSLVYHNDFGSRIPPEVGTITDSNTLSYITAYAKSALLSDPRVNKIVSASTTAYQNYAINVTATVLPNGAGSQAASVNEVLGPVV